MINAYYQDELRYLREVGPEFARANPEIARFLGDRGADPDVERILEGVAFLCGRIRQKLDDELPELTASMMALLWPHYLRPIPSMTILELLPEIEGMQAPLVVPAGSEFASVPVDGTRCRYRSCWRTTLRPWRMREVRLETAAAEPVRLVMSMQTSAKATLEDLDLQNLRLFLAGDPQATFTLYLLLAGHVDHITVSDGSSRHDRPELRLGPECVDATGLDRAHGVLPYPPRSFAGYRLLQEYLAFKDRFLFVDLKQLKGAIEALEISDTSNVLEVAVTFNRRLESYPLISAENVRLHCTPIINLFRHEADPIRLRHDRVQYLMQPAKSSIADRRHAEIYSVDTVAGLVRAGGLESHEFPPFYSFSHLGSHAGRGATYYQTQLTESVVGGGRRAGTDTYISFVVGGQTDKLPAEETISAELTCLNRDLPRELRAGDISEPTDSSPPGARFRNIIKPTPTVAPPLGKGLHWRLISHMSLNYVSLTDAEHFKELLRIYDFQSEDDVQAAMAHQRMLDGILSVKCRFDERLVRGAPLRGMQVEIELHEDHFAGEGDAYLFARILDRFLGLYVTLNAYTQLTVRFARSGQVYKFDARTGEQFTPAESHGGTDGHG
ncbi:MAG: type VI secretion system baseplate subunit TssF [bacterium]|nr:type VI secretion system baseplate subunit TssF [bacterium]